MQKKLAYIYMTFDTLSEYHLDKSLESFNNQNKSLIDTFIIYKQMYEKKFNNNLTVNDLFSCKRTRKECRY